MLGGSVWTTDHTCGRREAVEECGEQPREPRGKRARQNGSQGEKGRNGNKGRRREKKATHCTLSSTSHATETQQPLQQVQQQQQQQQQQARKCVCSSAPTTGVFQLKELVTKDELVFLVINVNDFLTEFKFVNVYSCRYQLNVDIMRAIDVMIGCTFVLRDYGARVYCRL